MIHLTAPRDPPAPLCPCPPLLSIFCFIENGKNSNSYKLLNVENFFYNQKIQENTVRVKNLPILY